MIRRYSFILAILLFGITASNHHFGYLPTKSSSEDVSTKYKEHLWQPSDSHEKFLNDADNRVSNLFSVQPYFYINVRFWFYIYTHFTSSHVLFHDKNDLSIVYKILDFSSLSANVMSGNILYVLQQMTAKDKLQELKKVLLFVANNPETNDAQAKEIYRTLEIAGKSLPATSKWRAFFSDLHDNIRTQTGQRDFIADGLVRSAPYENFIRGFFEAKDLPQELFAISFLESSFNPIAQSKAGAAGAWQFMPFISGHYLPKRSLVGDYRFNAVLSSVAAGHLLLDNFRIMKSWDLAVTAYNSGTRHLLKTKRELGGGQVSLEQIIKNSDSGRFGFASKNFYSEFLALVHTLAYHKEIFEEGRDLEEDTYRFYVSKCAFRPTKTLAQELLEEIKVYNQNFKDINGFIPRGSIFVSKSNLPSSKFLRIERTRAINSRPAEWPKLLGNQSCSTR